VKRYPALIFICTSVLLAALVSSPAWAGPVLDKGVTMASGLRAPSSGDLPAILKETLLVVGTTYAVPYYFFSPDGRERGYDYLLLHAYVEHLNHKHRRHKLPLTAAFLPLDYNRLIPALEQGYVDVVAAGLTITPSRGEQVAFTIPYLSGVKELVVAHKSVTGLKSLDSLAGRRVFVRRSSSYFQSLLKLNRRLMAQGLPVVKIVQADETLSTGDILEMVNAGIQGITVADNQMARVWASALGDLRVYDKLALRTGGKLAMMVRKSNPKLLASLNQFIKGHKKGTLLGNIYFNRYFKNTRWIKNPLDRALKNRLGKYIKWFKFYGKKYGIDWVLVAAQAMQESGLEAGKKSAAGAIGIMQVLPSLARDQRLEVGNLYKPQYNIEAGVQYLDFLRETYFDEKDISPDNQLRFALAAYNAGPGAIERMRQKAAKMGLDPNKWFGNVEVATLKYIGRETVRYVRNVNKYYVSLKLAVKQFGEQWKLKHGKAKPGFGPAGAK
jgi:membrane-bound lytic murein transglycosylase MltF